jgi:elongation factor G
MPSVDLPGLVEQIRETFGKECLPLNLPAAGGTKVVDCFFNPSGEADFHLWSRRIMRWRTGGGMIPTSWSATNEGDVDPRELYAPLRSRGRTPDPDLLSSRRATARHRRALT